jgi:hypothetical protein
MVTLYRKTAKGQTEIETRVHRLSPRLRTALILVDGRRADDELRKLVPGDADEAFRTLLADGFIEEAGPAPERAASRSAAAPAAVSKPAAPAADPKAFDNHRRGAVRMLNEHAGPLAETVAIRIEKCRTWDDLLPALQMAQRTIANTAGAAAATEFGQKFIDTRPG